MSTLKKIVLLLLIATVFMDCTSKGQATNGDQKISITKFKVDEKDNQLIINWATEGTVAVDHWELQSSTDGKQFSTFAVVLGPDPRQQGDHFQYKGKIKGGKPKKKYYRLCPVGKDGREIKNEIIAQAK